MKQIVTIQSFSADAFAPQNCSKTQISVDVYQYTPEEVPDTLIRDVFYTHVRNWETWLKDKMGYGYSVAQFIWDSDTGTLTSTGHKASKYLPAKEKKQLNKTPQEEIRPVPKYTYNKVLFDDLVTWVAATTPSTEPVNANIQPEF